MLRPKHSQRSKLNQTAQGAVRSRFARLLERLEIASGRGPQLGQNTKLAISIGLAIGLAAGTLPLNAEEKSPNTDSFAAFLLNVSAQDNSLSLPEDTTTPNQSIAVAPCPADVPYPADAAYPAGDSVSRPTKTKSASVIAPTHAAGPSQTTGPAQTTEPWWQSDANGYLLEAPDFVQIDLASLLTSTLESSPQISAISRRTSIAYEKIVQQKAVFDPTVLLETGYGRVNDPVGNELTTGGPPRSIQDSFTASGGIRKLTPLGTTIDLSQEIGTLQSNSVFFIPEHQGNSRLSLSITQPLMATSGRVYNTRLITQASIDSDIAWQQLRLDLEDHLIETMTSFWRLFERRSQLVQQRALIERGKRIGRIVTARADYDSGPLQQIKVTRRLASDRDRMLEIEADVRQLQVQVKTLVGSPELITMHDSLELIPLANPHLPSERLDVRDCIIRGLEHRADILAATRQLAAAGLEVNVTKNELMPRLNAVIDAYLSGLNGSNNIGQSIVDQYSEGGPGVTAALTYNLPWGRRAAKSRYRESRYRYQQRSEELRSALLTGRREIESALIRVKASEMMRQSRAATLAASVQEEKIQTRRWEMLSGDGGPTALILEDLLETQRRRTDAEQGLVTAQVNYVLEMIRLQKAMGTFLIREGVEAVRPECTTRVEILETAPLNENFYPMDQWSDPVTVSGASTTKSAAIDQNPIDETGVPNLGLKFEPGMMETDQPPVSQNAPRQPILQGESK